MLRKQNEKKIRHPQSPEQYICTQHYRSSIVPVLSTYSHNNLGIWWQKPLKHFKLLFSGTAYLPTSSASERRRGIVGTLT